MPKIKMNYTERGSDNGTFVRSYMKDQEYEVGDDLSNSFIKMGAAVLVRVRNTAPENKTVETAPENKELKNVPEDKKVDKVEEVGELVFKLAESLDVPYKEIIKLGKKLGMTKIKPSSKLSDEDVKKIKKEIKKG